MNTCRRPIRNGMRAPSIRVRSTWTASPNWYQDHRASNCCGSYRSAHLSRRGELYLRERKREHPNAECSLGYGLMSMAYASSSAASPSWSDGHGFLPSNVISLRIFANRFGSDVEAQISEQNSTNDRTKTLQTTEKVSNNLCNSIIISITWWKTVSLSR